MDIYLLYIISVLLATIGLIFSLLLQVFEKRIELKTAVVAFIIIIISVSLLTFILDTFIFK